MHAESEGIAISIIIPAFNSAAVIGDCLTALNRQDVSRNRYEIIVVDDGSQDATAEIAQSLADEVIRTDNRGPASARNTGARAARGDILLFTDADCIPEQPWVRRMTAPFESSDIHGVKGAYLTRQTRWVARFVQAEYESKYRFMSRFDTIDFIDTYSAAFRRRTFLELNGFDETFPGASVEDQEFSFRMSAEGYTMVFVADARVLHRHADTLAWYFRKKFNIGYWKVKVLRRHPGKTVSDTHTPQTLKLQLPLAFAVIFLPFLAGVAGWQPWFIATVLFIVCGWREILACIHRDDFVVAVISPVFMLARSVALALGLIRGVIAGDSRVSA